MIGVFARMFGANDRVAEFKDHESGLEVTALTGEGGVNVVASDAPPKAFTEKVEYEGGDVYVIPFMEAFRAWLKKRKDEPEESAGSSADES